MDNSELVTDKLQDEVPLFNHLTTAQQRETAETLAEIYSLIIALDHVEKAYLRDSLSGEDYTVLVNKLLAQYKTYLSDEQVLKEFGDLQEFKEKYYISASNAITRIERGIPVTVEHGIRSESDKEPSTAGGSKFGGKAVAEATGNFITVMDALKLNYRTKDQLHPLMSELLLSINRVSSQEFDQRKNLVQWIVKINKMRASEKLSEDDASELLFSLDAAYKNFYTLLE
ncbi:LAME_0H08042g1_1 [Lachancea meyersii CBS 8951]|uniref:Vacuolar protein sorting-associated protein 28 n=1 Tax=Lachancea meyersii CBS 8951 TaxID=1266667 RepID=A0A1G4KF89_9SACH|nr:LAME_0H08042g1_1 [Lachancea meyersii CBS 8951]